MSDLLTTAAEVMGLPEALVARSADARATADGAARDDVLTAWTGGAPIATKAAPEASPEPAPEEPAATTDETPSPESATEPAPSPVVTIEVPRPPAPAAIEAPVEEEVVDPVPLGRRLRTATRVGAWTGAGLGLFSFLVASTLWAPNASVTGEETFAPVVVVESTDVIIGTALVSILLGAIVAGLSRAAAGWVSKGMRLSNSPFSTGFIGAALGLALGLVAGALLTSAFGQAIEGTEGVVQLPVLATLAVMMLGGAALGALTAAAPQLVGVPVAVGAESEDEVDELKSRLSGAIGVPAAAALLLAMLVLPFAYALIQSNHLTSGGAAIIAVITASGILLFAALAGNKPNMRLTFGEVMIAVIGIATVIVVIFMVLNTRDSGEHDEEAAEPETAVVQLVS